MSAIQFTDRRTATRLSVESLALGRAASAAMSAPSLAPGRPWRWRIDGPVLSLHADDGRHRSVDVLVSCGIVLHHAHIALAAEGVAAQVSHVMDNDLLATISHIGPTATGAADARLYRAIASRRSDTRPFAPSPVPDASLRRLLAAAGRPGVVLRAHAGGVDIMAGENLLLAGEAASAVLLTATVEGLTSELTPGVAGAVATVRLGAPFPVTR